MKPRGVQETTLTVVFEEGRECMSAVLQLVSDRFEITFVSCVPLPAHHSTQDKHDARLAYHTIPSACQPTGHAAPIECIVCINLEIVHKSPPDSALAHNATDFPPSIKRDS